MGRRWAALLVAMALVGSACIGAVDRADFEAELRSRGGGVTSAGLQGAIDAIRQDSGVGLLLLRSLTATPLRNTYAAQVQDPTDPHVVDQYVVVGGEVVSVSPVQVSARDEPRSFPASSIPVDRIEGMGDAALVALDLEGASVRQYTVDLPRSGGADLWVTFSITAPRGTGVVVVAGDGSVVEAVRA